MFTEVWFRLSLYFQVIGLPGHVTAWFSLNAISIVPGFKEMCQSSLSTICSVVFTCDVHWVGIISGLVFDLS